MSKGISDDTENIKLYIILAPCSTKCKQLVLEVLSFHVFRTWVKHQIVI